MRFLSYVLAHIVFAFAPHVTAVTVEVPGGAPTLKDVNVPSSSTVQGDPDVIIALVQQINDYLWFSIAAVCLAVALYAGFKLLTTDGDKAKMKKANEILVGAMVGIFIAVFSYVIVRLVVNLF